MSDTNNIPIHYVSTHEKARELIDAQQTFLISNCGCREHSGHTCQRSRIDVCLMFDPTDCGSGSGIRPITRADALEILAEAQSKKLVARPFRNETRDATSGICFCCDDCCGYFLNPEEVCDKGEMIVATDFLICNDCGICVDFCQFHARAIVDGELVEELEKCYGCGLCATVCPEDCIKIIARA